MEKEKVINALNEFKQNLKSHFSTMYETMKTNFDFIKNFFTKENINSIEWQDIQKLGKHFYCMIDTSIARGKAFGDPNAEIESYRKIFTEMINDNISVKEKFDIFKKWNNTKDSNYGKKQLGNSFLSELLAYLSEECFIINGRTWINLHYFFDDDEIKKTKKYIKDGNDYIEINEKIKEIEHLYNEIVGKQTEFPINIELDQFFSWFSERLSKKENLSDENNETPNIKSVLEDFIIQSIKNFKTGKANGKKEKINYNNTELNIGYGQGRAADTTYITFTNYGQETNYGIYPVILYDNNLKVLEVCYGVSIEQEPKYKWSYDFIQNLKKSETKYTSSYVKNSFKIENEEDIKNNIDNIINNIDIVISDFHKNFSNVNNLDRDEKSSEQTTILNNNQPLNQILYGPPGTGKTYNTVIKAMEIIDYPNKYDNVDNETYKNLKNRFDELKKSGQIEFITFHQSYSYEEFIEGIKPDVKNTEKIVYEIEKGVFKKIVNDALFNMLNITEQQEQKEKDFDEVLNIFKINHQEGTELSTVFSQTKFIILEYSKDSIRIKPKIGNSIYSISYEPLQEIYEKDKENNISTAKELGERMDGRFAGISSYYFAILYYLKQYSKQINTTNRKTINFDKEKFLKEYYNGNIQLKDNPQKYILIIDEINRGNISKIFGEIITLIEEDKRIGNEHELKLTLPYSKKPFGIPKNLYIIGTMNTSDRSIASVDIALRRRFKFIEMMPKEELVTNIDIGNGKKFGYIFKALNEKITILLDRDHQIGHSYFLETKINDIYDLMNVWFDEILPLLNEYFYNDWEKLQALLGSASKNNDSFIVVKETNLPFYQYDLEDKVYDFIDKKNLNIENFKSALLKIVDMKQEKKDESEQTNN